MAPHSSTLAWKIPWAEEPGGLQSMGYVIQIVGLIGPLSQDHFEVIESKLFVFLPKNLKLREAQI